MDNALQVVIAVDSFKGSLSSVEAGEAIARGVLASRPDAKVTVVPVADGGEGTLDALTASAPHFATGSATTFNAFGDPLRTRVLHGTDADGARLAVIESAEIIGITKLVVSAKTPRTTSSYGLGTATKEAIGLGAERVWIGLGGTSTTDGGVGFLLGLGAKIEDETGATIEFSGGRNPLLGGPARIVLPRLGGAEIWGLADVTNPLIGPRGAARTFGPQKGATPTEVEELEQRMQIWADALYEASGTKVSGAARTGAAGGIGAAVVALGGKLTDGFSQVAEMIGLPQKFEGAQVVITGEGKFDAQSSSGKVPYGVHALARKAQVPLVLVLAGSVDRGESGFRTDKSDPVSDVRDVFDAVFSIQSRPGTLAEAMETVRARADLTETAAQVIRLISAAQSAAGRGKE